MRSPYKCGAPWIQNHIIFGHSLKVKSSKIDKAMLRSSLALKFVPFWSHLFGILSMSYSNPVKVSFQML